MGENHLPSKDPIRLEDWSTVFTDDDPYKAPELKAMRLRGKAYGHPRHQEGIGVITTRILSLDLEGRRAETRSGSVYSLGKPSEDFVKYLREVGRQDLLEKMGL